MKNNFVDPFTVFLPKLDLHGYDSAMARVAINDFILDNYTMGKESLIIIHGIGTGILIKTTDDTLQKNPKVVQYRRNIRNHGETQVWLNLKK